MKIYDIAHQKENRDDEHDFIANDLGKGQLVNKLQRLPDISRLVVIERNEDTGSVLDEQNAFDWFMDYVKDAGRRGLSAGDIVASIYKRHPLYKIERMHVNVAWVRPCDENGERQGAIQKSVPYSVLVRY